MDKIIYAAKYAALEAAIGFKPAVLRDLIHAQGGVERAFDFISNSVTLAPIQEHAFDKALSELQSFDSSFSILLKIEYPDKLAVWGNSTEVLYVRGNPDCIKTKGVAIVGSRLATEEGCSRANRLAKILCDNNFCVNSGLALGIDTAAHLGAFRAGGKTLAVIGTPISHYYPKENRNLQDKISSTGAVVSLFSPIRKTQPLNFPLRNELMSALSLATVIVEASETSGALTQAKSCLKQGRKLFIMQNQIERTDLKWPREFLKKGAIALKSPDDLLENLHSNLSSSAPAGAQMKLL